MLRKTIAIACLFLLLAKLAPAQERVDLNMMHKIKTEAFTNSKVMETMHQLTDRYGPRLTNSKQFRAAGAWAAKQLTEWGLSNVKLEKWAAGYPGWQYTRYDGAMVEPTYQPIIGAPLAWTAGTNGPVTGEAVVASVQTPADMEKYHGKLAGKIVLTVDAQDLPFAATPLARRYTPEEVFVLDVCPACRSVARMRTSPLAV